MKVIAIFDIGKTNKKMLLFNEQLKVVFQREEKFKTTVDEDGVECDDIVLIEKWILSSLERVVKENTYELVGVNFSTYGATLTFLDKDGKRMTPIYNYLKEIPEAISNDLFDQYGGKAEFCRCTASPALGLMLNSGIQIKWLKETKPEIFNEVKHILHFPQYLSYKLTNKIMAEYTSIGCHTFMWDFDRQCYHQWLEDNNIRLPLPQDNSSTVSIDLLEEKVSVGTGIHDSSSSLVPYLKGSKEKFMLISTGTWCINMNPFNHNPLTATQLENDCLSFLSIKQKPVLSSRLFMGHMHDVNVKRLTEWFEVEADRFKKVSLDASLLNQYLNNSEMLFFSDGIPADYIDDKTDLKQFATFEEAYHRLMFDLTLLNKHSMDLIIDSEEEISSLYISGGFARNEIFVRLLASFYPDYSVYTSEVDNASALGAALVIGDTISDKLNANIDLGLVEWQPMEVNV